MSSRFPNVFRPFSAPAFTMHRRRSIFSHGASALQQPTKPVTFATKRATVVFGAPAFDVAALRSAVKTSGYEIREMHPAPGRPTNQVETIFPVAQVFETTSDHVDAARWRNRAFVAWPLAVAVFVLSFWFMHEPWARNLALVLTVPVQFGTGWPFLRTALRLAPHRTANMDTLISIGTLAAFFFSAHQVVWGPSHSDHYLDSSAVIIAFVLLGRFFEARAKRRA